MRPHGSPGPDTMALWGSQVRILSAPHPQHQGVRWHSGTRDLRRVLTDFLTGTPSFATQGCLVPERWRWSSPANLIENVWVLDFSISCQEQYLADHFRRARIVIRE